MASASSSLAAPNVSRISTTRQTAIVQPYSGVRVRGLSAPVVHSLARQATSTAHSVYTARSRPATAGYTIGVNARKQWRRNAAATDEPSEEVATEDVAGDDVGEGEFELEEAEIVEEAEEILDWSEEDLKDRSALLKQITRISDTAGGAGETTAEEDQTQKEDDEFLTRWVDTALEVENLFAKKDDADEDEDEGTDRIPYSDMDFYEDMHATLGEISLAEKIQQDLEESAASSNPMVTIMNNMAPEASVSGLVDGLQADLEELDKMQVVDDNAEDMTEDDEKLLAVLAEQSAVEHFPPMPNPLADIIAELGYEPLTEEEQQLLDSVSFKPTDDVDPELEQELAPYMSLALEAAGVPKPSELVAGGVAMMDKLTQIAADTPAGDWLDSVATTLTAAKSSGKISAAEYDSMSSVVSDLQTEAHGSLQIPKGLYETFAHKVNEVTTYGSLLPTSDLSATAEEEEVASFLKEQTAKYPELAELDASLPSMGDSNEDEEDVEASIMRAAKELLEPEEYEEFLEDLIEFDEDDEDAILAARDELVAHAKEKLGVAAAMKVYGQMTVMARSSPDVSGVSEYKEDEELKKALDLDLPELEPTEEEAQAEKDEIKALLLSSNANTGNDGWGPELYLSPEDPEMVKYNELKAQYAESGIDLDADVNSGHGASSPDLFMVGKLLENAAAGKTGRALLDGVPAEPEHTEEELEMLQVLKELRDQDSSFQEVYDLAASGDWVQADKVVQIPYTAKEQSLLAMLDAMPGSGAVLEPAEEVEDDDEEAAEAVDLSDCVVDNLDEEADEDEDEMQVNEPYTLEDLEAHADFTELVAQEEEATPQETETVLDLASVEFDEKVDAEAFEGISDEAYAAELEARLGEDGEADEEDPAAAVARAEAAIDDLSSLTEVLTEDNQLTEAAKYKLTEAGKAIAAAKEVCDESVLPFRLAAAEARAEEEADEDLRTYLVSESVPLPPQIDPDMTADEAVEFVESYAESLEAEVEAAAAKAAKISSIGQALAAGPAALFEGEIDVDAMEAELEKLLGAEKAAQAAKATVDVSAELAAAEAAAAMESASPEEVQAQYEKAVGEHFTKEELERMEIKAIADMEAEELDEAAADVVEDSEDQLAYLLTEATDAQLGMDADEAEDEEGAAVEAAAEADEQEADEQEVDEEEVDGEADDSTTMLDRLVVDLLEETQLDDEDEEEVEEAEYTEEGAADAEAVLEESEEAVSAEDEEDDEEDEEDFEDEELAEDEELFDEDDDEDEAEYEDDAADLVDTVLAEMEEAQEEEEDDEEAEVGDKVLALLEDKFYDEDDEEEVAEEAEEIIDMAEDEAAEAAPEAQDEDDADELSTEWNTMEGEILAPTFDDIWEEMGATELRPKEPFRPRAKDDEDGEINEAYDIVDEDIIGDGEDYSGADGDADEDEFEQDAIAKYYAEDEDEEGAQGDLDSDTSFIQGGLALFDDGPTMGDEDADRAADDATGLLERVTVAKSGDVFVERIIQVGRVTVVKKGGKMMSFRCVAVVGNKKGIVGVGVDSAREVVQAVQAAVTAAKKNLIVVPLTTSESIQHRVEAKYKSASCVVLPAGEGTGVIAGGAIRSVLELAGVKNVLAKRLGSRNPLNNARATIKALQQLQTWSEIADKRDLSLEYLFAQNSEEADAAYAQVRGDGGLEAQLKPDGKL